MDVEKKALWDEINFHSKSFESAIDPLERKRTGSYYTDLFLTDVMMKELIQCMKNQSRDFTACRFLEPCVGTGNFVFSYLNELSILSLSTDNYSAILDNIYVADINEAALIKYRNMLKKFAYVYWGINLDADYFQKHMGKGLLIDVSADDLRYIPITDVFPSSVISNGFDIVVTNPPYKNLKAERGHYSSEVDYSADKKKYASITRIVDNRFQYSTDGVLNLYKLFVEEIVDNYSNENAMVSLLIPASILSDKTCQKLRTHLLMDAAIRSVKVISEGSGYLDAQQTLCTLLINKGDTTRSIEMTKDFCTSRETTLIHIEDIMNINSGNSIMALSADEYDIVKTLRKWPTVKELPFIINLRGELDLTSNKKSITASDTGYKLLRGRNVGYYRIIDTDERDFVSTDFVLNTKKNKYIMGERIICQQIANMHKERRVTFALVPKKYVLGNSCNFIAVNENDKGVSIYTLLGLFNAKVINWLFKLTSSNNHINNYEIDSFPVPIGSPLLQKIDDLVRMYLKDRDESVLEMIENIVCSAYGIKMDNQDANAIELMCKFYLDIKSILPNISHQEAQSLLENKITIKTFQDDLDEFATNVINGILTKYRKLLAGEILNHTTFKLSDLDLEMIKTVPQGGSWKDIPEETVKKSKRLLRITETGGRTTLYGRIDYDKPCYTITTYFNRPGNGTYIHPVHERVLSVREAARFQSFTDDYFFFGNKTQLLKQVGNAVPPLLAYQIAQKIINVTRCKTSIDLFCGAGGMTAGFKAAGIKSVLSNDIEQSACITLKINNPEINVLCGDITSENTKETIVDIARKSCVDLVCGGPPCQGFSMAGLRLTDDPRNRLFRDFIDVVRRVKPKVVVFENVEGILSFRGGKTYQTVHEMFSEIGYETKGRILMANEYAVPQKRKRVIIICTRYDLNVSPDEMFPSAITSTPQNQITAKQTIHDLEPVDCSESASYTAEPTSDMEKFFRGTIDYNGFLDAYIEKYTMDSKKYTKTNNTEQMILF